MRNEVWKRPSAEERADHVRTLKRLGQLVVERTARMPVWFVVSAAETRDRSG